MSLSDLEREELDHNGYVVLPGFMGPARIASIQARIDELFAEEGDRAGSEFKQEEGSRRLANLVDKGSVFREVIMEPMVLEYVDHVLGHEYKLSSLNARSADPETSVTQPLHADMAALADGRGFWVCNTVWMLDDFTEENGALRCVPGSQKRGKLPRDAMNDPRQVMRVSQSPCFIRLRNDSKGQWQASSFIRVARKSIPPRDLCEDSTCTLRGQSQVEPWHTARIHWPWAAMVAPGLVSSLSRRLLPRYNHACRWKSDFLLVISISHFLETSILYNYYARTPHV